MLIGVPKEIKNHEYRVGLTPGSVKELKTHGHHMLIETGAGQKIGLTDSLYEQAGASIKSTAKQIWDKADLIIKVKEPQERECLMLHSGQTLFTYLHLAADKPLTQKLIKSGVTAIAYETVTNEQGGLPLLAPMSEVAGRLSIQAGATSLEAHHGGSGVLLGGVPGVRAGKVTIIGAGMAGSNAARMAMGLGAEVTILDKNLDKLTALDLQFNGRPNTLYSTQHTLEQAVASADLLIGAVLIPGASAPKLVSRKMLKTMAPGSAIVDIAIDQGGCIETSRPTSHEHPRFIEENIVHYCVTNMPGAVAQTSTFALNNATLPFILDLANKGIIKALQQDRHLMDGLTIYNHLLTSQSVSTAHQIACHEGRVVLPHQQLQN